MTLPTIILTVSQLNRKVRSWLEHEMGTVSVEGELSNVIKPASGHYYFTLKDPTAQLRCVYFRNRHINPEHNRLENGQQVIIRGNLSLYEARGDYQLIVEDLRAAGQGDLYQQFELLKTKLSALGLFDSARKKALPRFPLVIGVITSATGAALRDILSTLERRYPIAPVIVYASEVQGQQAALQLIQAIHRANQDQRCDVLILARGGGSMEDLWPFNDERLAYAIAKSHIPIASGVGHETDFTIADFVADFRAETPTAAAVAITPNRADLVIFLNSMEARLLTAINRFLQHRQLLLRHDMQKLASPREVIRAQWQSLDYLRSHMQHAMQQQLSDKRHALQSYTAGLEANNPSILLQQARSRLQQLEQGLIQQMNLKLHRLKQVFGSQLATVHAVSPLATLDRGYAIVSHNQKILFNSHDVKVGDTLHIRLAKGELLSKVESIGPRPNLLRP